MMFNSLERRCAFCVVVVLIQSSMVKLSVRWSEGSSVKVRESSMPSKVYAPPMAPPVALKRAPIEVPFAPVVYSMILRVLSFPSKGRVSWVRGVVLRVYVIIGVIGFPSRSLGLTRVQVISESLLFPKVLLFRRGLFWVGGTFGGMANMSIS